MRIVKSSPRREITLHGSKAKAGMTRHATRLREMQRLWRSPETTRGPGRGELGRVNDRSGSSRRPK